MRTLVAGTLLVGVFLAAGCGGSSSGSTTANGEASKSAKRVLADAAKAAEAASSLHMSGRISGNGQPIGVDLTIVNGKGATGSLTLNGQRVELVIVGDQGYIKASSASWTQLAGSAGSAIAQLLQGKWLKFPTTNAEFGQITTIADSEALFRRLGSGSDTLENGGATTYKGQSVVKILDTTKSGTAYVAATGTAYPVALVVAGGTITFDKWNAPVSLTPPSGAVDVSNLSASGGGANGSGDTPTIRIASGTPKVGSSASPAALQGAADVAKLFKGIPQRGLVLGDPGAPVTLIEYIDLQCPICQEFEASELAPLVEKYVRPGKLAIKLQPWAILDRTPDEHDSARGQKATIAAAAQNKAFNFAEVLYDNQGTEATGWLNDAMISKIAASVDGLDPYRLAKDANSAATRSVIKSITNWANSHPTEMTGTPTLYLAKGSAAPTYYGTGIPDLGTLEAAIDALLK